MSNSIKAWSIRDDFQLWFRRPMPIVTITGPSGPTKDAKRQLIEGALRQLMRGLTEVAGRTYLQ